MPDEKKEKPVRTDRGSKPGNASGQVSTTGKKGQEDRDEAAASQLHKR